MRLTENGRDILNYGLANQKVNFLVSLSVSFLAFPFLGDGPPGHCIMRHVVQKQRSQSFLVFLFDCYILDKACNAWRVDCRPWM